MTSKGIKVKMQRSNFSQLRVSRADVLRLSKPCYTSLLLLRGLGTLLTQMANPWILCARNTVFLTEKKKKKSLLMVSSGILWGGLRNIQEST